MKRTQRTSPPSKVPTKKPSNIPLASSECPTSSKDSVASFPVRQKSSVNPHSMRFYRDEGGGEAADFRGRGSKGHAGRIMGKVSINSPASAMITSSPPGCSSRNFDTSYTASQVVSGQNTQVRQNERALSQPVTDAIQMRKVMQKDIPFPWSKIHRLSLCW
jgi:hypothetical protein